MVRAALTGRHRIGREPAPYAPYVPAASVVLATCFRAADHLHVGWYPISASWSLISWRLLRADPGPRGGPLRSASSTTCSRATP